MIQSRLPRIGQKLKDILRYSPEAGTQAVRSSVIVIVGRIVIKGIQFIRTIVLARLLFPNDFGLFGLASIAIAFTDIFFQTGFSAAIVHEKDDIRKHLSSAWTVVVIRNTLIALAVFFAAPLVGGFFDNDAVIPLVRFLSLVIFVNGFENLGVILFQKELRFNKKFLFDFALTISEVIVVIIAAFVLRNAWALAVGSLGGRLAAVFFSYRLHAFRPKFTLDTRGARHLFRYGKWVSVMAIAAFLVAQGDYVFIGKLLNPNELGFYQLAFALGLIPAMEIARVLGNVLFPLYAKIQEQKELLRRSFIRVGRIIFAVTIPASFGLLVLSHEIVEQLYGERWLPMVPALIILILYGLVKSFEFMTQPLFLGIGKPRVATSAVILQAVVMFSLIIPLTTTYGILGTAVAVLGGGVAAQVLLLVMARRELTLGIRGMFQMVSVALLSSAVMYFVLAKAKTLISIDSIALLATFIVLGVVVYAATLIFFDRLLGRKIVSSLQWVKKNI